MSRRHDPTAACLALVLLFGAGALAQPLTQPAAQPLTQAPAQPLRQPAAQPLTLEATIAAALEGPDVRLARLQLAQAEATAASAAAALSGTLRTGARASWSNTGADPGASADLQPLSAQLTLNLVPYGPTFDSAERAREAAGDAAAALEAAVLQAALSAAERWWAAERAGRAATQAQARLEAAERARRDAGPTASLSTSVSVSGESGRASLGAGIDTRSYQPSLELSVDPWVPRPEAASASLSLKVTLPLGPARSAEIERADLAVTLERERLASARTQARLELEATHRAVEQAAGQLQLALDRLALRVLQHQAVEVRATAGTVAPLDLARSIRDLDEAALALARALDAARVAQARLALDLGRPPFAALGLDAATQERFDALLEGILQEVR